MPEISPDELRRLDRARFVELFGGIFEHSPWVAEAAYAAGPFASLDALHRVMVREMRRAPHERKLALIRAHPDLAGRAAIRGELSASSSAEQASAGLDQCSPEEHARFLDLNSAYQQKFKFPFIMAVKDRTRAEILGAFERRLGNPQDAELEEALEQIARIARLRLEGLIAR